MNRNNIFAAMAALIVGFLPGQAIVAHAEETQPNIVFILADDMGYGDLKAYNPRKRSQGSVTP